MPQSKIVTLRNEHNDILYPQTVFKAIINESNQKPLEDYINDIVRQGFVFGGVATGLINDNPTQSTFYIVPPMSSAGSGIIIKNTMSAVPSHTLSIVTCKVDGNDVSWDYKNILEITSNTSGSSANKAASQASIYSLSNRVNNLINNAEDTTHKIDSHSTTISNIINTLSTISTRRYKGVCHSLSSENPKRLDISNYTNLSENDIIYISFSEGISDVTSFQLVIHNDETLDDFVVTVKCSNAIPYSFKYIKKDKYYPFLLSVDGDTGYLYLIGDVDENTQYSMATTTTGGLLSATDYTYIQEIKRVLKPVYIMYNPNGYIFNATVLPDGNATSTSLLNLLTYCLTNDTNYSTNYHFVFTDHRPDSDWITNNNPFLATALGLQDLDSMMNKLINVNTHDDGTGAIDYGTFKFEYNLSFFPYTTNSDFIVPDDIKEKLKERIEKSIDRKFHIYFDFYNITSADPGIEIDIHVENTRGKSVNYYNGNINSIVSNSVSADRISSIELAFTCINYKHLRYQADHITPDLNTSVNETVFNTNLIVHHNAIIG